LYPFKIAQHYEPVPKIGIKQIPEPDFNITTELKNVNNTKKTDGAIIIDSKTIACLSKMKY